MLVKGAPGIEVDYKSTCTTLSHRVDILSVPIQRSLLFKGQYTDILASAWVIKLQTNVHHKQELCQTDIAQKDAQNRSKISTDDKMIVMIVIMAVITIAAMISMLIIENENKDDGGDDTDGDRDEYDDDSPDSKVHGANMGPTWGHRTQVGPMLAPWTLLSGRVLCRVPNLNWGHLQLDILHGSEENIWNWAFAEFMVQLVPVMICWDIGKAKTKWDYRQTSNTRRTKAQLYLVSFCSCLCPIYWSPVLSREWRCRCSSADILIITMI